MAEPLAERMRPKNLNGYVGQQHLIGPNGVLRRMIDGGRLSSIILWGPPGVGKTTLARIIATSLSLPFYTLSAVTAGVKEVRDVIERASHDLFSGNRGAILFIDEIHRFSKSQQDSLLGAVEQGTITLIGATTENPSFEIIRPLLSRCQVYTLQPLTDDDLLALLSRVMVEDRFISQIDIEIRETSALLHMAGGDARKFLNIIDLITAEAIAELDNEEDEDDDNEEETTTHTRRRPSVIITDNLVSSHLQANPAAYDKGGELHYDLVSAMIKSIRGSDPDGALYYMARMIEGGEDPAFIARRLVISASEDVGLANPNALLLANAAFDAVQKIGWPEGRIPLAEAAVYLATSPKSNSAYMGINQALSLVQETGNQPVPLHLRNAPTKLMKEMGYGQDYKYAHDYDRHFVRQQYLPDHLTSCRIWHPQNNPAEARLAAQMAELWGDKYTIK